MEKKISFARRMTVIATVIAGALLFSAGLYLYQWRDAQYALYNQGMTAYRSGDLQVAIKNADQSLAVYKSRRSSTWMERFIYPKPDKELAAQAAFLKAKALLRANQPAPAVQSFQESLELNSGNLYGRDLTEKEFQEFREAAMIVKYDLELLFKNNPEQAQKQGKGKGKGDGEKKDGAKPVPGDDPGNMPGKGNRDTI